MSKELENINFELIRRKDVTLETIKNRYDKILESPNVKIEVEPKTQLAVFQSTTKLLFAIGKCIGLSPMTGAWDTSSNMSLGVFFRKFLLAIVIGLMQAIGVILSAIYFKLSFSTMAVGTFIFYLSTGTNTFLSIYIRAARLPKIHRELYKWQVNDYYDPSLKIKSYAICIIILTTALFQQFLYYISKIGEMGDKSAFDIFNYDVFTQKTCSWYYDLGGERTACVIIIQIANIICILNWNYSDMYTMCISLYLVSLMNHINKKIVLASDKHYLPPSYWRALREEYSRVTRLVHSFNDVSSSVVLISFANTMFFLCLQLYRILLGLKNLRDNTENNLSVDDSDQRIIVNECSIVLGSSAAYLLARTLAVSLIAATVHSASLVPATALYNVPSSSFSREVARFLNQVHTDTVAISGLDFFYVTRELILSLVGTIITYELVLLQFEENEKIQLIFC